MPAILNGVVREGFLEAVTFQQRLEDEQASHDVQEEYFRQSEGHVQYPREERINFRMPDKECGSRDPGDKEEARGE